MDEAQHRARVVIMGSYAPSLLSFRGRLIEEMVCRGHHVFALAPGIDQATAEALRRIGAEPIVVAFQRTSLDPFNALKGARELRLLFAQLRPDVVIAYTIKPVVLAGPAARAVGARFIPMITGLGFAFLHGAGVKQFVAKIAASALYRRAFKYAAVVLFQNADDEEEFRRRRILPRRIASGLVNGSGVDLTEYEQQPVPSAPVFLMIARFLRAKGVREYAGAAIGLKTQFPAARFCLAGWIDESPDAISPAELDQMVRGGVEHLGHLSDVRPALAQCSVYVLPSYREGTPRSVLEAMAVGRAILTTDAPGCRETVVEGENGLLVPVGDQAALERAMRSFLDDHHLASRMGAASRRLAERKYEVGSVNKAILGYAHL